LYLLLFENCCGDVTREADASADPHLQSPTISQMDRSNTGRGRTFGGRS
jgi:hypothetical protein